MSAYIDGDHSRTSLASLLFASSWVQGSVGACHLQSEYGWLCPQRSPCNHGHDALALDAFGLASWNLEEPQLQAAAETATAFEPGFPPEAAAHAPCPIWDWDSRSPAPPPAASQGIGSAVWPGLAPW